MNPALRLSMFSKLTAITAVLLAAALVPQGHAQITNLSNGNSAVAINFGSQAGMYQWTINGQNQLAQQWFWYRVGSDPSGQHSIDTIGTPSVNVVGNSVEAIYTAPTFGIDITYTLTGSSPGQWTSDVTENISIYNLSASPIDFNFFQYSDFALGGSNGNEVATIYVNNQNFFTKANVTKADNQLSETIDQPLANAGEADLGNNTLNRLNSGNLYDLNNNIISGPDANLDATWALEWNFTLGAQGSDTDTMNVIKDKKLSVQPIPEPGLMTFGVALLSAFILRRKR